MARRNKKRRSGSSPIIIIILILSLLFGGGYLYENYYNPPAPISLSEIPEFSDSPYVCINGNIPFFTNEEITTESYESYSPLDELGRCGVAIACIGRDTMPKENEERAPIAHIKPSGWNQAKYDCVPGEYLYDRCHLIGFQLTAENDNEKNLITGTGYMNVSGMLPFENEIAKYIEKTGNHVMYRVTPIYNSHEDVARGVLMEAYSVEDNGDGIQFCVYCYNNQPGVVIDYRTGRSWLDGETPLQDDDVEDDSGNSSVNDGTTYILNTETKKIHIPSCSKVPTKEENKAETTKSLDELHADGYSDCGICKPQTKEIALGFTPWAIFISEEFILYPQALYSRSLKVLHS